MTGCTDITISDDSADELIATTVDVGDSIGYYHITVSDYTEDELIAPDIDDVDYTNGS